MKKTILLLILIITMTTGWAIKAEAVDNIMTTFESLYPGFESASIVIPAGYGGFTWGSSTKGITKNYYSVSGYNTGITGNVGITSRSAGQPVDLIMQSATPFTFRAADITAAWNLNETVTVEGWRSGALVYTQDIVTSWNDPQHRFEFGYMAVDEVRFKSLPMDGTDADLAASGAYIAVDNIQVPEPSSFLILASALLGMIFLGGRLKLKESC